MNRNQETTPQANPSLLKAVVIFSLIFLLSVVTVAGVPSPAKCQIVNADFSGRSLIVETKDGTRFSITLSQEEYENLHNSEDDQDYLVSKLIEKMGCLEYSNKLPQKTDPNLNIHRRTW